MAFFTGEHLVCCEFVELNPLCSYLVGCIRRKSSQRDTRQQRELRSSNKPGPHCPVGYIGRGSRLWEKTQTEYNIMAGTQSDTPQNTTENSLSKRPNTYHN